MFELIVGFIGFCLMATAVLAVISFAMIILEAILDD